MVIWLYAVFIFTTLFIFASLFIKRRFAYWKTRGIPHDEPSFPGGNIKGNRHISEIIRYNYQKFKETGPFGGFFLNLHPAVVLYDSDLIKDVLVKDFHNFPERGLFHNERDDPLTANLFRLDENEWKNLRSQLSPSFSGIRMKDMFLTIVLVAQRFLDKFAQVVKTDSIVEMNEIIARYVTDVNGICVFGLDCNSLNDDNAEFFRLAKAMSGLKHHSKIVNVFISSFPTLSRKLRMRQTHDDVSNFFTRVVREIVAYREKNSIHRNDFLNLMIDLKNSEDGLSVNQIAGQAFAYFYAGFENSTALIGVMLYELALNQEIQDILRSEITTVMEKYGENLTFECMMEMRYLKKVAKETLRKYPIVPFLMRLTKNDYQTFDSKYTIPSGTFIIIPIEAIQNDPEIYPEPEKFDPERFRREEIQQRHSTAWLPFGDGPRHCIGLRFAKMQIYAAIILLLKNNKVNICNKTVIPLKMDPKKKFLGTKAGIYLHVERI